MGKIKYLIIRFSSIGDIVLTTPVIRGLKQQVDNAEIHYVTKNKHASIVRSNPFIDKVHVLKENINELLDELEKEQLDYIIDLHQNFRSNRIKSRLKLPAFSFEKLNFKKFLMIQFKINRLPEKHIVDRYLDTVSVFDVQNDQQGLDFFIPEKEQFDKNKLPKFFQQSFLVFVIAGTYFTKRLPVSKIIEICNAVDLPIILLGGQNEIHTAAEVDSETGENVLNLVGKLSLNESASLVRAAKLVLANDTGLMHIATAFKKKVLSFWGNTVPEFGMYPYQAHPDSKIIEVKDLKCRPCSKLGFDKCPKKHFNCMNQIEVQETVRWIKENY
ncbi:glycosyltransferase family 9 protein [Maribellus maritimus]|uniref:glycosyltransferase family 9 protein n=1 Tax=Maribellus maritimus TaxID=2870838 RepID=UPI001EEB9483|nr:glycosyltransferase family 9 protein [Maribellus maritimus]MCG6188798.1 glycosyltransferase family 9 protein [Maribellus maritimus]